MHEDILYIDRVRKQNEVQCSYVLDQIPATLYRATPNSLEVLENDRNDIAVPVTSFGYSRNYTLYLIFLISHLMVGIPECYKTTRQTGYTIFLFVER